MVIAQDRIHAMHDTLACLEQQLAAFDDGRARLQRRDSARHEWHDATAAHAEELRRFIADYHAVLHQLGTETA